MVDGIMGTRMAGGNSFLRQLDPHHSGFLTSALGQGSELLSLFPSAEVIGNDLSPSQPSLVPPNVKFMVDDVEDE
ncbi:hypothetical protein VTN77DRAFT_9444 [Rasamsonia byssochlamydoides]|uniref:uncharacterized protein n=1 Tax=Rasamsonia byssochlamydoides TaxID=89139 RepID=UPI0037449761